MVFKRRWVIIEKNKKMGRPTEKPKNTQIAIRLDDETLNILDKYCKQQGVSRAEGTRRAIHKLKK